VRGWDDPGSARHQWDVPMCVIRRPVALLGADDPPSGKTPVSATWRIRKSARVASAR